MKNILFITRRFCLPVVLIGLLLEMGSCKKSAPAAPVITSVRNYVSHPGDSLIGQAGPGQWIVISGNNLKGALQINFDGVASSFNEALFSDTSAVVLIPAVIAFPIVPANKLNTITYITTHGQTTFTLKIFPPAPSITRISNENALPGDSVTVYGLNLFFIQSVTFAGASITTFNEAVDGTFISFPMPSTTHAGPVTITTTVGTAITPFTVNDVETGVLSNFDDLFNYAYFSANITNDPALFPGAHGNYAELNATNIGASDYAWYNGGRGINLNPVQWIPAANINDPIANYVIKFEMYTKTPWSNGTIYLAQNFDFTYIARYEPWLNADGSSTPFMTKGWQTITIPASAFKTKPSTSGAFDGTGVSITTFKDLLGAGGNQPFSLWIINNSSTPIPAFDAAFDNLRIEKIK
ncbi:MAG TPA: glycan-binding surface protein [Puia sp.]|jgi:hypothetical protein